MGTRVSRIASRIVLATVASLTGVSVELIKGTRRHRSVTEARQLAAAVLRRQGRSLPEIGTILNKDHATILYACRRVEASPTARARVDTIALGLLLQRDGRASNVCQACGGTGRVQEEV